MTRILIAIGIMTFVLAAETVRATERNSPDKPEYTSSQIRKMVRDAHTVEQYTELANYYAVQRRIYKSKAVEQMHLWRQRSEMPSPLSEKWPRPVDSARNLHDYYEYKAEQSAELYAKYDRLADSAAVR